MVVLRTECRNNMFLRKFDTQPPNYRAPDLRVPYVIFKRKIVVRISLELENNLNAEVIQDPPTSLIIVTYPNRKYLHIL
jgi:hypothetical protein